MVNHAKKRQKRAAEPRQYIAGIGILVVFHVVVITLLIPSVIPVGVLHVLLTAVIGVIVILVTIAIVASIIGKRYISSGNLEVEELWQHDLIAMRVNNDRIHGEKVWFRGFVDTEPEYRYLHETSDGGYELASIPANRTKIYCFGDDDEDQTPRIVHWQKITYSQNLLANPPVPLSGTRRVVGSGYSVYVPQGSTPTAFELI